MFKKLICIVMSVFMLTLPVCAEISEWAETEVSEAINSGYVPENFSDDWTKPITKAEFAELAVRYVASILGYEITEFIKQFSESNEGLSPSGEVITYNGSEDFSFSDTDSEFVTVARRTGMLLGNGDGTFLPESSITREQAAVMLFRTYNCYDYSGGYSWHNVELLEDHNEISDWAYYAVSFVLGHNIMNGISETLFAPQETYTREQAVATFVRMGKSDMWKNWTDKAVIKLNPAVKTKDYVINEMISKEWISLDLRIDTEYGTVLHTTTSGIPHSPNYSLVFVDNNGKTHSFSDDVPPCSGWQSKPKHENIKLSEDGKTLTFDVSFSERMVVQYTEPTVLHEAGTYYFEADLTTGECLMKEFVAVE